MDKYDIAAAETDRLTRELDITNADHIAVWLEANLPPSCDDSVTWLAVQIVEAHERATPPADDALSTMQRLGQEFDAADDGGLRSALTALVAKIDECAPHVADAFLHRQMRVGEYTGPTIETELNAARQALSRGE